MLPQSVRDGKSLGTTKTNVLQKDEVRILLVAFLL